MSQGVTENYCSGMAAKGLNGVDHVAFVKMSEACFESISFL